jgi:hypothetical protein
MKKHADLQQRPLREARATRYRLRGSSLEEVKMYDNEAIEESKMLYGSRWKSDRCVAQSAVEVVLSP